MADNTQINQNTTSGDIIATEDIGGVKVQRVKTVIGTTGVDNGDVSISNPMPVTAIDSAGNISRIASEDAVTLLRRLIEICEPLATQDGQSRQRISLDAIAASLTLAAVTTVTTVTTVTNQTNIGGYPAQWQLLDIARNSYSNGIRRNLNWS